MTLPATSRNTDVVALRYATAPLEWQLTVRIDYISSVARRGISTSTAENAVFIVVTRNVSTSTCLCMYKN
jgi:hypothetical protein